MGFAIFVDVLEQFLARQVARALDDAGQAPVVHLDLVVHAALAAEAELHIAAVDFHVAVAQRRQAKRFVGARVFLVPDPHHRRFEQVDDRGQHFFARQAGQLEGAVDFVPDRRQRVAELEHAFVLHFIARCAPFWVIAVLLAPARIAPRRLQVAVGLRADPDVLPRGRNHQALDARQCGLVLHRRAMRVQIAKAVLDGLAVDAGAAIVHVAQAGRARGAGGVFGVECVDGIKGLAGHGGFANGGYRVDATPGPGPALFAR